MQNTAQDLHAMASFVARYGLHTGEQFAARGPSAPMDICAVAYIVAERCAPPAEFYTDEAASLDLIEASDSAMHLIRAISGAIDNYEVPDTDGQPDVIEHVSQWTFTPPIGCTKPPSTDEVIGCILRAAEKASGTRFGCTDAWGLCTTCGGHGSLQGDEIPYSELRPRQQQGHDHGRRYHRSRPCPDCDGQDRVTDAAVSAYEASL